MHEDGLVAAFPIAARQHVQIPRDAVLLDFRGHKPLLFEDRVRYEPVPFPPPNRQGRVDKEVPLFR
jgi:hypothetical protein